MKLEKKLTIIISLGVIALTILALFPKDVTHISNAVVNEINGDIAICYDIHTNISMQQVVLYDKNGNELFSKSIIANKVLDLYFDGDVLYVSTNELKPEAYAFERNGKKAAVELSIEEISSINSFNNWKNGLFEATYYWQEYIYCYKKPHFFRHSSIVTITINDDTIVIFEDK